jgi:predicted DNA-binding protein (UPF0278 family)
MTISDYQISSVIRNYVKNMRGKLDAGSAAGDEHDTEDRTAISEEGMKRMVFERIGEKMTERLKKHEVK